MPKSSTEIIALWEKSVGIESLILEAKKLLDENEKTTPSVLKLDEASVQINELRTQIQQYRNSIIQPD